jgi:hypothetical protein
VGAEEVAVGGVDDQLDEAFAVLVEDARSLAVQVLARDPDLVAGLARRRRPTVVTLRGVRAGRGEGGEQDAGAHHQGAADAGLLQEQRRLSPSSRASIALWCVSTGASSWSNQANSLWELMRKPPIA